MQTKTVTVRTVPEAPPPVVDSALELIAIGLARWLTTVDSAADVRVYADVADSKGAQKW